MPGYKRKYSGNASSAAKRPFKGKRTARKFVRRRRPGSARPMRALRQSYRGAPNQYRYVRETRPVTIDLGTAGGGISIIAGTGVIPSMSVLEFPNFEINQLPGFTDFTALYANYKIDKIDTILIPQWQNTVNPDGAGSGTTQLSNLMMTRVNTKYLPNGMTIPPVAPANNAEGQRDELAQIQKKSRSLYGTKRWLRITTSSPDVLKDVPDGSGGTNLAIQPSPWLPTTTAADQQFKMNDVLFADRLDGKDFVGGVWVYRMYHRVHFRCAFVG